MKVGIVGLGLIGGSLARDLAESGVSVIGFDRSAATLRAARRAGVIAGTIGPDFEGVESCDVCVIAAPVDAARELLARAAPRLAGVSCITDVGSTKRSILKAAKRLGLERQFVGGHPFAGYHASGWRSSRTGLFAGSRVFLCPGSHARREAVSMARRMWRLAGARLVVMDADAHDALVARVSHLPQVASSVLALTLASMDVMQSELGPGGRDVTRLAGSDPEVWSAIAMDNADKLVPLLARLERTLRRTRSLIASGCRVALRARLENGVRWSAGRQPVLATGRAFPRGVDFAHVHARETRPACPKA